MHVDARVGVAQETQEKSWFEHDRKKNSLSPPKKKKGKQVFLPNQDRVFGSRDRYRPIRIDDFWGL